MAIPDADRLSIQTWCREQTPEEHAREIRVEAMFRGDSATILERRPPWPENSRSEWSEQRVAKLTRDPSS